MKTTFATTAAALALVACIGANAQVTQQVDRAGAEASHRMKSIDEPLNGVKYLKDVNIQPAQARALALKACAGRILFERLQRGGDGKALRYVFTIEDGARARHRVAIDANDGVTLENSKLPPPE